MSQPVKIHLPDEQLKQYLKLRQEDERLGENLGKLSAQLEHELIQRRTKYLTRHEVQKLNPEAKVYQGIGKAFILETVPNQLQNLRNDLAASDKTVLTIKKTGIYIQNQQDQIKLQINELVKPFIGK